MADKENEETTKKSGGNTILIIIIALLVLLLIGGGLAAFLLLDSDDEIAAPAPTQGMTAQASARSSNMLSIGPVYPMEQFIVNLLSESGSRYLKVTLDIELDSEKLAAEMDAKHSAIRDIIIRILSAKTYEEISTLKGKDRLKDEIVSKINEILTDGRVRNIFFTDFVIQ